MTVQSTYNLLPLKGFAGKAERNVSGGVRTGLNEEAVAVEYGIAVIQGATERGFATPNALTDDVIGVTMFKHRDPEDGTVGIPVDTDNPVMEEGDIYVQCEEAIALGDRVFVRVVIAGAEVPGSFRTDADGVAQVTTVTPTAVNDTDYSLNFFVDGQLFGFKVTSDVSATATEICDDFRTEMQADAVFDALVTSGGTTTLVLTAADTSKPFSINDSGSEGVLAIAATTANAPDCFELTSARWLGASFTGDDGEITALLRLNRP